ncbi:MAG TPA: SAM-dependent methyltransferase, partial [Anaerolineae bacterium]
MKDQLTDTARAFDSVAADYDGPLGNNALIQRMRAQVMDTIEAALPHAAELLDL